MNFAKFLRTLFLTEHLRWLLLLFGKQDGGYRPVINLKELNKQILYQHFTNGKFRLSIIYVAIGTLHFFFSIWVFFHEHSRFTRQQGKVDGIYLTPLYHFHPLHRYLDISRAIAAESSPLHIAGSRTRTGNLWFPSASRQPPSYAPLKDAYFSVPLSKEPRKCYAFDDQATYTGLFACFGLGPAPWNFMKLLNVSISILRRLTIRIVIYLDDMPALMKTIDEVLMTKDAVIFLLQHLGFIINLEKSD